MLTSPVTQLREVGPILCEVSAATETPRDRGRPR